jgi:hypothetical protein
MAAIVMADTTAARRNPSRETTVPRCIAAPAYPRDSSGGVSRDDPGTDVPLTFT